MLLLNLSLFLGHSKNPRSLFITDDAIFKITLLSISYIDHCSILRNEYYIIDVKFYMYARERKYNAWSSIWFNNNLENRDATHGDAGELWPSNNLPVVAVIIALLHSVSLYVDPVDCLAIRVHCHIRYPDCARHDCLPFLAGQCGSFYFPSFIMFRPK